MITKIYTFNPTPCHPSKLRPWHKFNMALTLIFSAAIVILIISVANMDLFMIFNFCCLVSDVRVQTCPCSPDTGPGVSYVQLSSQCSDHVGSWQWCGSWQTAAVVASPQTSGAGWQRNILGPDQSVTILATYQQFLQKLHIYRRSRHVWQSWTRNWHRDCQCQTRWTTSWHIQLWVSTVHSDLFLNSTF